MGSLVSDLSRHIQILEQRSASSERDSKINKVGQPTPEASVPIAVRTAPTIALDLFRNRLLASSESILRIFGIPVVRSLPLTSTLSTAFPGKALPMVVLN